MVSMVSSFKRGGWDSFYYVVLLFSCVGVLAVGVSSFKRGGWDSFHYVVLLCSCVGVVAVELVHG